MIFLPKCRAFYVVLEKGHDAGKKGMALEKRAWRGAMLKLARGNTSFIIILLNVLLSSSHQFNIRILSQKRHHP